MRREDISSILAAGALTVVIAAGFATSTMAAVKPAANLAHGKQLYVANGCYQCHGTSGEGGAGPRLAPGPIPLAGWLQQLRRPRLRMPFYTEAVMPDKDVEDVYAYMQSMPKGKTASEIPMLKALTY
jgi:mono/diheme cytochrome c family protein